MTGLPPSPQVARKVIRRWPDGGLMTRVRTTSRAFCWALWIYGTVLHLEHVQQAAAKAHTTYTDMLRSEDSSARRVDVCKSTQQHRSKGRPPQPYVEGHAASCNDARHACAFSARP
eukprot:CAMPEP_0181187672 /NCGR_PEP_ID=MMETSP1096-20121128/10700_1 /TAXON_ID=156174 ORGANISM="Chrysochromulina ericina, Strain CCMP281" /NCGR_SAMPLE_ID=MMETSP1096 /ASSEMBLY_ACC=CAM_ASM_000453 /LENGTH=115 /DNA_ID=CAMNT_0023276667 /DNA_START=535 /DNA_END=879 /DNA_ORIENTATION=+